MTDGPYRSPGKGSGEPDFTGDQHRKKLLAAVKEAILRIDSAAPFAGPED